MAFFKSKKKMSEIKDNLEEQINDNLSQDENTEELLSREFNVDDSVPGTQFLEDEAEENSIEEKLKAEVLEMKDKYLRLMAEFDNFKRRTAKEKEELRQTAGKEIVQSLLVVLDDMDRASKQMETASNTESILEGINLVFSKLRSVLQQKGLRKMESLNTPFDADLHDAITEIPVPDEAQKGTIMDEIEPGYYLNEKLIRHAKVVVGK
jgi:molecular chaperone GrpE